MKKKDILDKLQRLRFCILWPGNWEDVGFTERPIWINSDGFGYCSCDEPCCFFELHNCTDAFVKQIKEKLSEGELTQDDLKGSPLDVPALDFYYNEEWLESFLDEYSKSTAYNCDRVFCGEGFDCWYFFETEEDLIQEFERLHYDCFEAWENMSYSQLSAWNERLFKNTPYFELPLNLSILEE